MSKRFGSGVYVEVEVDGHDIEGAGYHHEDDCPAKNPNAAPSDREALEAALQEMHLALHGDQPTRIERCLSDPCRRVYKFWEPVGLAS